MTKQQTQQEMQQQSGEEQMEMGNGKALSSAKSNGRAVKAEEGVCIGGGAKDENGQQPMEGVCGAGEKQEGNAQQGENREAGQDREAEENREAGQDRVTGESRGGMSSGEGGEVTAEALQDEHQQAEASIIQVCFVCGSICVCMFVCTSRRRRPSSSVLFACVYECILSALSVCVLPYVCLCVMNLPC